MSLCRPINSKSAEFSRDIYMNDEQKEDLRIKEERLLAIFDSVNDAIFVHDLETGAILDVNQRMCEMFGYSREEALTKTIGTLSSGIPPYTQEDALHWIHNAAQGTHQLFEWQSKDKTGRLFWTEINMRRARIGGQDNLLVTVRDISDRKRHEREIERLNRLYTALSQVNQAIVRVCSKEELYQEVTRVLVEFGKFTMAWIGLLNPATQEVELAAQKGDDSGYLQRIQIFADDRPTGRGPTGTAIREGRSYICNDFINDPCTLPWREAAATAGWRSLAVFPIRQRGKVCGVLTIYDRDVDFFGEREVALLEEAAMDVSFGLDNLEREALRAQAVEELRTSEEKFRNIFENAPVGIFQSTVEGRLLNVNPAVAGLFAYDSPEEMINTISDIPKQTFVHPEQRTEILREALNSKTYISQEVEYYRKDGSIFIANLHMRTVHDNNDEVAYLEGFIEDITERRQLEDSLLKSQKFLSTIIEAEPECVKLLAADGSIQMMNRAGLDMLEVETLGQFSGKSVFSLIDPEYRDAFITMTKDVFAGIPGTLEFKMVGAKGRPLWLDTHAVPLRDDSGEIVSLLGITRNITKRKKYEEQLLYQANYDTLTGLPNRNLLNDLFIQSIAVKDRDSSFLALMLMDLDNFKFVNDTLGHPAGDLLLIDVAKRIQTVVRKGDTVARLGGDEFVVVPGNVAGSREVARVAEQILAALSEPFSVEGREVYLTASIGIVVYPHDGDSLDILLKHADVAMYHAKHLRKNNFQFFTAEINSRIHERLAKESKLRRALEKKEFLLYYQPLIELRTRRVLGMEALLRWQPAGGELLLPEKFIPLLEETGLIIPIGEWVLINACQQLNEWRQAGHDIRLSVNISARQFHSINIVERISKIVRQSGCLPSQICLELTESVIMEDSEGNIKKLMHLREMGFSLSIDDFGTGFSSLNYLKRLPISEIKIDRTFVKGLPSNVSDTAIVNTIIHMANYLGMNVVAEGIETEEQMLFLSNNACDIGQGYFFSEPLLPNELTFQWSAH